LPGTGDHGGDVGNSVRAACALGSGWLPAGVASCSTECVSLFRFVSFRPAGSLAEVTPVVWFADAGAGVVSAGSVGGRI